MTDAPQQTPQVRDIKIGLDGDAHLTMRYRDGTKDLYTIRENWTKHPYRLGQYAGVLRRQFLDGSYEQIVSEGRTPLIIDAGANIGASALFFAWRYPKARIVAVEPEADTFGLLIANTQDRAQVRCVHGAVASRDGRLTTYDPGRGTDAFRVAPAGEGDGRALGEVDAWSIPSLLALEADAAPLLLKLDIEGAEAELFSRDTDWIDAFPVIAIELHDWMLPCQASSAPFLREVSLRGRDFINPPSGDIVFSLRNLPSGRGPA